MKKVLNGMLLVLILLFPIMVKADMSAPSILEYEVIVVKEGGADYYVWKDKKYVKAGHLDKDTEIYIREEETSNNVTYLFFYLDQVEPYTFSSAYEGYYVKATDVMPKEEVVTPDSNPDYIRKLEKPITFKVWADEVPVREGPSNGYKTVGTLKKGYIGKYSYYY